MGFFRRLRENRPVLLFVVAWSPFILFFLGFIVFGIRNHTLAKQRFEETEWPIKYIVAKKGRDVNLILENGIFVRASDCSSSFAAVVLVPMINIDLLSDRATLTLGLRMAGITAQPRSVGESTTPTFTEVRFGNHDREIVLKLTEGHTVFRESKDDLDNYWYFTAFTKDQTRQLIDQLQNDAGSKFVLVLGNDRCNIPVEVTTQAYLHETKLWADSYSCNKLQALAAKLPIPAQ